MRLTTTVFLVLASSALSAQTPDTLSLQGRHLLSFTAGLTSTFDARAGYHGASFRSNGALGAMAFTHYVRPQLAVEISAAVLGSEASADYTSFHDDQVLPVLFGLSYSPEVLALSKSLRPF